jgi:hypothetical protein
MGSSRKEEEEEEEAQEEEQAFCLHSVEPPKSPVGPAISKWHLPSW